MVQAEIRYDLSPLQLVGLFESLQPSRGPLSQRPAEMHCGESVWMVDEPADARLLARAWQLVMGQHPVLRSCFGWEDLEHPVQRVLTQVDCAPQWLDWRERGPTAWRDALAELLDEQRDHPARLDRAPLVRLFAIRIRDDQFCVLLVSHALLLDDWSIAAVVDDLLACYQALRTGAPPAVAPRPGIEGYLDRLADQGLADTEAFWRAQLKGFRAQTRLAAETAGAAEPGPAGQASTTLTASFGLEPAASRQLRALATGTGLELETLVVGGWALLVSRYAGESDVVIGYDVPGRAHGDGELAGALGAFRNAVPLRVAVDEHARTLDWLTWLQRQREAVQRHEHVAGALIREWSEIPRTDVLFRHRFGFMKAVTRPSAAAAAGLPVRREAVPGRPAGVLDVRIEDTGTDLAGVAVYRPGLSGPDRVPAIMSHLARILAGFAAGPAGRLADISMLTEPERVRLLGEWNSTTRSHPTDLTIYDMFSRQVAAGPEKTAVVCGDRSLCYRELAESASRWAGRLRRLGVGPDRLVGVHLRRGPDMVALLLGVLAAGGAYVPLDPAYPFGRLAFMVADARLTVLVTDQPAAGAAWSRLPCPVLALDGSVLADGQVPAPAPAKSGPRAGHLAYVLYTSGSTGRPNGVAITHRNAVDLLHWSREVFADDLNCVLATTSICFDCSILELFGPLCWGGTTVLADSALDLRSLPADRQVRLMHTVPSVMAELLRRGEPPPALRTVILGGESPWPSLISELRERGQVERIFNLYGPTEVTSYATAALVGADGLSTPPSIGRPVANTEVYLLDRYGNPVPVGLPGELYVAGDGLARGYLHQPARTAERFVASRFGRRPGTRLYRTGDLAWYRPDGTIAFLGRADDQMKMRGFRIEPGEIEQALLRHPAVTDGAVIARQDQAGRDDPAADRGMSAYVAVTAPPPRPAELRDYLRALLPSYMIPGIIVVEELPRLPNGKVDRQALRRWQQAACVAGGQHYLAPGRPAEHVLARLWAELLGLDQVGVEDNFFDLGGDSFRAIQMVARAEEAGLKLTLTDVLEHQTIAGLATLAESQQAPGSAGQPADHVDSRSDLGLPAGPRPHRGGDQLARPRSA